MEFWTCEKVCQWIGTIGCHGTEVCDIFFRQKIDGFALKYLTMEDIDRVCPELVMGFRKRILVKRDEYVKNETITASSAHLENTTPDCSPNPVEDVGREQLRSFDSHPDITFKYKGGASVPVYETRADNLTTPIHKFVDIGKITRSNDSIPNICRQTVLFACACLNDHTNGTIHFGIKDQKIGGVQMTVSPQLVNCQLTSALKGSFDIDQLDTVLSCVRPAKFIEVMQAKGRSKQVVIEVDVRPESDLCGKDIFYAKAPGCHWKNQNLVYEEPLVYR